MEFERTTVAIDKETSDKLTEMVYEHWKRTGETRKKGDFIRDLVLAEARDD